MLTVLVQRLLCCCITFVGAVAAVAAVAVDAAIAAVAFVAAAAVLLYLVLKSNPLGL